MGEKNIFQIFNKQLRDKFETHHVRQTDLRSRLAWACWPVGPSDHRHGKEALGGLSLFCFSSPSVVLEVRAIETSRCAASLCPFDVPFQFPFHSPCPMRFSKPFIHVQSNALTLSFGCTAGSVCPSPPRFGSPSRHELREPG